ncbi:MAG: septum formation family protein [Rhodoglobus sp.]
MTRIFAALSLGAATVALAACSGATAPTPSNSPAHDADVFTVKVGNCVNDAAAAGEVVTVPIVDCAKPHDSEAYASIAMTDATFPGDDGVKTQSIAGCTAAFNTFVGVDYGTSKLQYTYLFPTAASWAKGDREILCLIDDPAGHTTGSLKGAAR